LNNNDAESTDVEAENANANEELKSRPSYTKRVLDPNLTSVLKTEDTGLKRLKAVNYANENAGKVIKKDEESKLDNNNGDERDVVYYPVDEDANYECEFQKKVGNRVRNGEPASKVTNYVVKKTYVESAKKTDVKSANEIEDASAKETGENAEEIHVAEVKPFTHSQEGLLRLIRLDLGILEEKELDANCKTVDERIDHNIKSEKPFDPQSKKLHTNIHLDNVKDVGTDQVLARPGKRIQTPTSLVSVFMKRGDRKEKEMGSEYRNTIENKDDEEIEYGEGEERKKVMGMSDIHLVSVHVYYPD
jgi:hypothetical protein